MNDRRLRGSKTESELRGDRVHLTVYLTAEILVEVLNEAERQERPVGWLLREAVRIGLPRIRTFSDNSEKLGAA